MTRRAASITQADVARAIRAARAVLGDRARVTVTTNGATIVIEAADPTKPPGEKSTGQFARGLEIVP